MAQRPSATNTEPPLLKPLLKRSNSMSNHYFNDLIYCSKTGFFYRSHNPNKQIGSIAKNGYVVFHYKNKLVYAHRIAWQIVHGFVPPKHIDHINRIKTDNRIDNLRLADDLINSRNRSLANKNNLSCGLLGVTKPKHTKKWIASIWVNRKRIHLGYFHTSEEAHQAYIEAKKIYHPTSPHLTVHEASHMQ
jgi:hypothetical protein